MTKASPRQQALEKRMVSSGKDRYWSQATKAKSKGREATTAPGRRMLRESIGKLAEAFDEFKATEAKRQAKLGQLDGGTKRHMLPAAHKINELPSDVLALLTAEHIINGWGIERKYTAEALALGRRLQEEISFRHLQEQNPLFAKQAEKAARSFSEGRKRSVWKSYFRRLSESRDHWKPHELYGAGCICIEVFIRTTGIVESRMLIKGKRKEKIIALLPETIDWIKQCHEEHEYLRPLMLPMLDEPMPWTSLWDGGYKTAFAGRKALVKPSRRAYFEEIEEADLSKVFKAVNKAQGTAWEINSDVYEVFKHCWGQGFPIGDLPPRDDLPIPDKPEGYEDLGPKERRPWKRLASDAHRANRAFLSKRLAILRLLGMAEQFVGTKFYFPYQVDFRGRLYTLPKFLDPQGPDAARGILRFANEELMTTQAHAEALAIHGANCFGLDKVPFKDRLAFVTAYSRQIAAVYADPLESRWWEEADKPWQFLAFCLEYGKYLEVGLPCGTKIPCQVDGSNNGLQIFSLLLRDEETAASTNVSPTETPHDIYQDVADRATELLRAAGETEWLVVLQGRIPRGAVKRPVMTYAYSSTRFSCSKYVQEWVEETCFPETRTAFGGNWVPACTRLAGYVWKAVNEKIVGAKVAMDWLRAAGSVLLQEGVPFRWTTPVGFLVIQDQRSYTTREICSTVGTKVSYAKYRHNRESLSKKNMLNGISPNYVHSLDSAVLMETVCNLSFNDLFLVHDGFGCHATRISEMATTLRASCFVIFSENQLENLRTQLASQTSLPLPPIPELGNLDPACVLKSDYFFA